MENERRLEQKKVVALIPAYEPDHSLIDFLKDIKERTKMSIVLVNDGSSLKCKDIFEEAVHYAKVVQHSCNRGKGAAIKTGLRYIEEHYALDSIIVTMDADGQHRLEDAVKLVRAMETNETALALGVREFTGDVPMRSRFGNSLTKGVFHLVTGKEVRDTQTGLRAFTATMIPMLLKIEGERYEYEMNVLLTCSKLNIEIKEIKIETIYENNNAASHFKAVRDSLRIYSTILKFVGSSLLCFLLDYMLFNLFIILSGHSLVFSNLGARIFSATMNFALNRAYVFNDKQSIKKTAIKYAITACIVLFVNTVILSVIVEKILHKEWIAKIIVETLMFIFSFAVQQFMIFNKSLQEGTKKR